LKARFQFATIGFCGAIYLVFGFVALNLASNLNSKLNSQTNLYWRIWDESIAMEVLGLALFLAAFLVSYPKPTRLAAGGLLGAVSSVLGALLAIDLLSAVVQYSAWEQSLQAGFFQDMLTACLVGILLVGFPLGMVGSLGGIRNSRGEDARSEP
jgi:hypothetical protein